MTKREEVQKQFAAVMFPGIDFEKVRTTKQGAFLLSAIDLLIEVAIEDIEERLKAIPGFGVEAKPEVDHRTFGKKRTPQP